MSGEVIQIVQSSDWTNVCQALATVAGVFVTLGGFIFLYRQATQARRSIEVQTHAFTYQMGLSLSAKLLENSKLRPYFYEGARLPTDKATLNEVFILSDMFCDVFEFILCEKKSMNKEQGLSR